MIKTYITKCREETINSGKRIGAELKGNEIIGLIGTLGSGKTTLVKGIAEGLQIDEIVLSPSFSLINEYIGSKNKLYHFDLYRIKSSNELIDLGIDEYLQKSGVKIIEWIENYIDFFPIDIMKIQIVITGDETREIHIC